MHCFFFGARLKRIVKHVNFSQFGNFKVFSWDFMQAWYILTLLYHLIFVTSSPNPYSNPHTSSKLYEFVNFFFGPNYLVVFIVECFSYKIVLLLPSLASPNMVKLILCNASKGRPGQELTIRSPTIIQTIVPKWKLLPSWEISLLFNINLQSSSSVLDLSSCPWRVTIEMNIMCVEFPGSNGIEYPQIRMATISI